MIKSKSDFLNVVGAGVLGLSLTACGGGGGGSNSNASISLEDQALRTVLLDFYDNASVFDLVIATAPALSDSSNPPVPTANQNEYTLSKSCNNGTGSVNYLLQDNDGNLAASAGDQYTMTFNNCTINGVTYQGSAVVSVTQITGTPGNVVSGWQFDVVLTMNNLVKSGLFYPAPVTNNGSLAVTSSADGQSNYSNSFQLPNAGQMISNSTVNGISISSTLTSLSFSLLTNAAGDTIDYHVIGNVTTDGVTNSLKVDTNPGFHVNPSDQYPTQGIYQYLVNNQQALQLEALANGMARVTLGANPSVDLDWP